MQEGSSKDFFFIIVQFIVPVICQARSAWGCTQLVCCHAFQHNTQLCPAVWLLSVTSSINSLNNLGYTTQSVGSDHLGQPWLPHSSLSFGCHNPLAGSPISLLDHICEMWGDCRPEKPHKYAILVVFWLSGFSHHRLKQSLRDAVAITPLPHFMNLSELMHVVI